MPPKRPAAALGGGRPVTVSPSPKRLKVAPESSSSTQQTLEAFFTSPKKTKPKPRALALEQQEVIVIDDEAGEHHPSPSTRLPSEHSNERTPAAGNGSDCGAGPVIIPATSMMEEDRLGVRRKDENRQNGGERRGYRHASRQTFGACRGWY
jgi:hypothetical protein